MTAQECLDSKLITLAQMDKHFKQIARIDTTAWDHTRCEYCMQKGNIDRHNSEPWTSCYFCRACRTFNFVLHPDRMGGDYTEVILLYQEKS